MIRKATRADVFEIHELVRTMGSGMGAGLRVQTQDLTKKIESRSDLWFVLTVKEKIVGICGLSIAQEGVWGYRIEGSFLKKERFFVGGVQMCSYYILPQFRRTSLGGRLAIWPVTYIEKHSREFSGWAFGEMRGLYREDGRCPFWDAIQWPFKSYEEYTQALCEGHEESIVAELPEQIDIEAMPLEAQQIIGKCHPETIPMIRLSERYGFRWSNLIGYSSGAPFLSKTL